MEDKENLERIQNVIQKRLGKILPEETPLLISSLDERCRQLETKVPNEEISDVLAENFGKSRKSWQNFLEEKRDCVIPDRIERMIRCMAEDIRGNIDSF